MVPAAVAADAERAGRLGRLRFRPFAGERNHDDRIRSSPTFVHIDRAGRRRHRLGVNRAGPVHRQVSYRARPAAAPRPGRVREDAADGGCRGVTRARDRRQPAIRVAPGADGWRAGGPGVAPHEGTAWRLTPAGGARSTKRG